MKKIANFTQTYRPLQNLQRCILNIPFFKPYNIVGMGGSLSGANPVFKELIERFD